MKDFNFLYFVRVEKKIQISIVVDKNHRSIVDVVDESK